MRAVVFRGQGGPEVIGVENLPDPVPARHEVLVRVRAAALNRADLLQRRGLYPPPPGVRPDVPGLELAGEVSALGEGVTGWRPGDRVMAITAGEAQAELCVVHERMLLRVPERLPFEEAGALPEAGITSHDALFTQGGLRPGMVVLLHAVGSGVATLALQLARAAGATAVGTSRTAQKLDRARALGLDHGILVEKDPPRFAEEVRAITLGEGTPLVLELVGGSYLSEDLAALAPGGRIVVIGTMGGSRAPLDLGLLLHARATLIGTTLRQRPLEEKMRATHAFGREALPLVLAGKVRPIVEAVLPLESAREAHERMERNESFGKIVLRTS